MEWEREGAGERNERLFNKYLSIDRITMYAVHSSHSQREAGEEKKKHTHTQHGMEGWKGDLSKQSTEIKLVHKRHGCDGCAREQLKIEMNFRSFTIRHRNQIWAVYSEMPTSDRYITHSDTNFTRHSRHTYMACTLQPVPGTQT